MEGAAGDLGAAGWRPLFPKGSAPALLGFDRALFDYCSEAANEHGGWGASFDSSLAYRCVGGSQNVMRLVAPAQPWNLCVTLAWLLCAVQGRLPMQSWVQAHTGPQPGIHFASAPKGVDWRWWDDAARSDGQWLTPHTEHFAASDVFFAEVAVLYAICANGDELFTVGRGDMFGCDFDRGNYVALVTTLLGHAPSDASQLMHG
jgi:hypothetical protein